MHLLWRLRTNAIDPKRTPFKFGTIDMCVNQMIVKSKQLSMNLGLQGPDGDHHQKQQWPALRRLTGVDEKGKVNSKILDDLWERDEFKAVVMYLTFVRYCMQVLWRNLTTSQHLNPPSTI